MLTRLTKRLNETSVERVWAHLLTVRCNSELLIVQLHLVNIVNTFIDCAIQQWVTDCAVTSCEHCEQIYWLCDATVSSWWCSYIMWTLWHIYWLCDATVSSWLCSYILWTIFSGIELIQRLEDYTLWHTTHLHWRNSLHVHWERCLEINSWTQPRSRSVQACVY